MSEAPMREILEIGYIKILQDDHGQAWAKFDLTPQQSQILGKKISPLICWKRYDLCGKGLSRPHLVCLRCHLRWVIEGKIPALHPVNLFFFWIRKTGPYRKGDLRSRIEGLLCSKLFSMAEFFS